MKNGEHSFQTNSYLLFEMLELRRLGWSLLDLAMRYNKNHTSILHQCRKYNVVPEHKKEKTRGWTARTVLAARRTAKTEIKQLDKQIVFKHKYSYILNEPKNPGKTYQEYLKDANYTFKHLCGFERPDINVTGGNKAK